ncbi:MAG TPA: SAP domain-containing protein [Syntrophobacteraceae bacterium]|nr:SAP domain-containing protein [Syntrophobacteraceae bacterium]HBD10207.1 SAP domain-containing protein [Syntrophobacteraceae bacterium]HBZ57087.1 SAP domain-containing protein [Syntrophobacteraceae bacterium]
MGGCETYPRKNFLDLTALVRSIQRAEGNMDCFQRRSDCDQLDCSWRSYCLNASIPHGEPC